MLDDAAFAALSTLGAQPSRRSVRRARRRSPRGARRDAGKLGAVVLDGAVLVTLSTLGAALAAIGASCSTAQPSRRSAQRILPILRSAVIHVDYLHALPHDWRTIPLV
ncbi:hypothetical protein [Polyangium mundeleinium]|uniref:Uncharacterized protein n=1 Tax=Polyangium mundeleinium TaxID=2995306 RepID=A0ABT5EU31_9BACT|nr:hypothetical protein [Polyangium mundeleinium]MDC0745336.1 hypothetical protein [Polyangium mundeleinium]